MRQGPIYTPETWEFTPAALLAAWPRSLPLATLCSGAGADRRWARWTILASPTEVHSIGAHRDPLGELARLTGPAPEPSPSPVPFAGGWLAAFSYELGRAIEPAAGITEHRISEEWPTLITLWRCPWAFVYDHAAEQWWVVREQGSAPADPREWVTDAGAVSRLFSLGPAAPSRSRSEYLASADRAIEYIHAGDCFQVNLAHHLRASFSGSTRTLFGAMLDSASPWYGAYLETELAGERLAALSVSPELFLRFDAATRELTTRPIKGTRRASEHPDVLRTSPKDQAELNMIIDLMRNDLGRVCETGSVRVVEQRAIEQHVVHHGVATITGRVRADRSLADLLRATFPGGSITGAPKVRAMQIIEELEPEARGLYTGAIGYISNSGDVSLNIAIRTAIVRGQRRIGSSALDEVSRGTLSYGVGAGIVADSVPEMEWQETLDKAGVLRSLPITRPIVRPPATREVGV